MVDSALPASPVPPTPTAISEPDASSGTDTGIDTGADTSTGSQPPAPRAGSRLPSLTGLRFAAAFLVFGFHLGVVHLFRPESSGDAVIGHAFGHGAIGVSFFFVLSGFVLTWSARPGQGARRIWQNRAAKIYPNHLVTALLALVVVSGTGVGTVVPNLLLVQAWSPRPEVYFGLNTPAWSLSCEAFFYLCFPFLLPLVNRIAEGRLWPAAAALVAVVWGIPLLTLGWTTPTAYWFVYVFPPTRIAEFCLGMVLARIVRTGRWVRVPMWCTIVLLVAAYASIGYLPERVGYVAVTVVPLALLIGGLAEQDARGRRTLWARDWAIRLGEISFAFYLLHQLVIRFAVKALPHVAGDQMTWSPLTSVAAGLSMLAASLAAAWTLYRFVEMPLNSRMRGRGHAHATTGGRVAVEG